MILFNMSKLEESEQLTGKYGSMADHTTSQVSSLTHRSSSTESSRSNVEDFERIQVSESGGLGVRKATQKTHIYVICVCACNVSYIIDCIDSVTVTKSIQSMLILVGVYIRR